MRIIELIHDSDHPESDSNVDLWVKNKGNAVTKRHYVYKDTDFPKLYEFDLLIVHGGSQHLWNKESEPWLNEEIRFVKKALIEGKPVIGFCLGSQIIAEAFGGKVFQNTVKETGYFHISPYLSALEHPLLKGLNKGFSTLEWHGDHYTMPEGFDHLAYTEASSNQIIAGRSVPAVGFQFHPEYTRQIILSYSAQYSSENWCTEEGPVSIEDFLTEVSRREETYGLFEKLMNNVMAYFVTQFPGILI